MKLAKVDVFLLKFLYLLAAGLLVFQVLGRGNWTSLLFYMTFPVTVLLWLRTVRSTLTGMDLLMLGTIVLAAVCVLVDAGIHNAALSFTYIKKIIIFSMTLMFLQIAYRIQINQELVAFINTIIDLLTVFLIIMFFLRTNRMFAIRGRASNYLTFQLGNPNLTGLFLTSFYMLELYRIFTPEKWYWKILHVIFALFLIVFVLLTQARNCLVALLLFTVFCTWLLFRSRRNMRISKGVALMVAVFPVLFIAIYMFLVRTPWAYRALDFLISEGKSLDSRVKIWEPALEFVWISPVIGAYYGISNGTGMSQMHNSHLDIAASYGIPVLILVCILLRNYLYQKGKIYEDKQGFIYILGFACAIILGIGEAALFSGGLSLYVFVGSFLLLSRRSSEKDAVKAL